MSAGRRARIEKLVKTSPYIFEALNPRTCYPTWDRYGLQSHLTVTQVRIQDIIEQYGSIFDIIGNLPLKGTAKYIQNLNTSKDTMLLSYQLIDIRSFYKDAIGEHITKLESILDDIYLKDKK